MRRWIRKHERNLQRSGSENERKHHCYMHSLNLALVDESKSFSVESNTMFSVQYNKYTVSLKLLPNGMQCLRRAQSVGDESCETQDLDKRLQAIRKHIVDILHT